MNKKQYIINTLYRALDELEDETLRGDLIDIIRYFQFNYQEEIEILWKNAKALHPEDRYRYLQPFFDAMFEDAKTINIKQTKVSPRLKEKIRALWNTGKYTQKSISDIYNLAPSTVSYIVRNTERRAK